MGERVTAGAGDTSLGDGSISGVVSTERQPTRTAAAKTEISSQGKDLDKFCATIKLPRGSG
jgi:hypothetical protein